MKTPKNADQPSKKLYGPVATKFSSVETGSWRSCLPVFNNAICNGCKQCEAYCPCRTIQILAETSENYESKVDKRYCKGCGICASVCKNECITMEKES